MTNHERILGVDSTSLESSSKIYFNKPSLPSRIKAMLADTMVIIGLMLVIAFILNSLEIESGMVRGIAFLLVILYEPILVTFGGTIGHRFMGMQVSKMSEYQAKKEHENINFLMSLVRFISKAILGWIALLIIHSDDYGQAIHDKIGGSVMTFR